MTGVSSSLIKGASTSNSLDLTAASGVLPIANGGNVVTKLTKVIAAADQTLQVPAGYRIDTIDMVNSVAAAVTGGIKIGSTLGGVDICAAVAVGVSGLVSVADAAILKRIFAGAQTLFIDAVVAWNGASITISISCLPL